MGSEKSLGPPCRLQNLQAGWTVRLVSYAGHGQFPYRLPILAPPGPPALVVGASLDGIFPDTEPAAFQITKGGPSIHPPRPASIGFDTSLCVSSSHLAARKQLPLASFAVEYMQDFQHGSRPC